jgi:NodT family efflux transporter outer membrane factor (OMF) lipoprotein
MVALQPELMSNFRWPVRVLLYASSALLGACAVGPDYSEPRAPQADAWQAQSRPAVEPGAAHPDALAAWWQTLNDPLLDELVAKALAGSQTVAQARARVAESRARYGVATASLFPSVDGDASVSDNRTDGRTNAGSGIDVDDGGKTYGAGLDAGWELDLFGGQRRSVEAAGATLGASEADLRDVLVTLLGDVALSYIDVRTAQSRLTNAERNLETQRELLDITGWQSQAGLATALEVEQANSSYEQTRAQLPSIDSTLQQAINRLSVLTGEAPGALDAQLAVRKPIPVAPLETAAGVPADVLRRRPDIRAAERRLAAQTAQIGVAQADLYPSLSLTGAISWQSDSGSEVFDGVRIDRSALALTLPIFHAGALRQNVRAQSALADQALASYEATVLAAYEEVENALTAWSNEHRRNESLIAAAASARVASELALMQYNSGIVDFQTVLNADRNLIVLEDSLAVSDGEMTANYVRLYKALGGGWSVYPASTRLAPIE